MPMYALATIPLMDRLPWVIAQVWYADDACACGGIRDLHLWWNQLCVEGPSFGYFVNASKTCKEDCHSDATTLFSSTDVNVTTEGCPYLGAAIGSATYIQGFVYEKVAGWLEEIIQLAKFAQVQLHAAYAAFTHGLSSHWLYACHTMPNISQFLQPLKDKIRLVCSHQLFLSIWYIASTLCSSSSSCSLIQLPFLLRSIQPLVTSHNHSLILFLAMIPPLSMWSLSNSLESLVCDNWSPLIIVNNHSTCVLI